MLQHKPPIKVAVIGAGQVSQMCHIEPLTKLSSVDIVAISDLRPQLVQLVAERYRIPKLYSSHLELLENEKVDAVIVVTNRSATGAIVRDIIDADINVFTEKPLARTRKQVSLIQDCLKKSRSDLRIGYMKRHDVGFLHFKNMLDLWLLNNERGKLLKIEAWSHAGDVCRPTLGYLMTDEPRPAGVEEWSASPDWLDNNSIDEYELFLNVHIHIFNWLYSLTQLNKVSAVKKNKENEVFIDFESSNCEVSMDCKYRLSGRWDEGAKLYFEKGDVMLRFPAPFDKKRIASIEINNKPVIFPDSAMVNQWSFFNQMKNYINLLINNEINKEKFSCDVNETARNQELVEDVWRIIEQK